LALLEPDGSPPSLPADTREAFAQGSESDEAIQLSACGGMDCFASLAMTVEAART